MDAPRPTKRRLVILARTTTLDAEKFADSDVITSQRFTDLVGARKVFGLVLRYDEACLVVNKLSEIAFPLYTATALSLLARRRVFFVDGSGTQHPITVGSYLRLVFDWVTGWTRRRTTLRRVQHDLVEIERETQRRRRDPRARDAVLDRGGQPVYIRTDFWLDLIAGGAVSHTAGVINHLGDSGPPPVVLTSGPLPSLVSGLEVHVIAPGEALRDDPMLRRLAYNHAFVKRARDLVGRRNVSFVYHRYSPSSYVAVQLARMWRVPLVLEFNSSKLWMNKTWGKEFHPTHQRIVERIEQTVLEASDYVVTVSDPNLEHLLERGIERSRILVNPNGVEPAKYSPEVDGSEVRKRHGLEGKTVVAFIGSFGRYHGVDALARAFARLLREHPAYREKVRLLLIGDGTTMPAVRSELEAGDAGPYAVLTGLVPQDEGPKYLAAADILVSPHLPNPDGTRFWGSPVKIFEYMSMGKGIVASALEQIAQILRHDQTAWLVKPGDVEALAEGLRVLIDDPSRRRRLGEAAREEAVRLHSWRSHTQKIIEGLETVVPSAGTK